MRFAMLALLLASFASSSSLSPARAEGPDRARAEARVVAAVEASRAGDWQLVLSLEGSEDLRMGFRALRPYARAADSTARNAALGLLTEIHDADAVAILAEYVAPVTGLSDPVVEYLYAFYDDAEIVRGGGAALRDALVVFVNGWWPEIPPEAFYLLSYYRGDAVATAALREFRATAERERLVTSNRSQTVPAAFAARYALGMMGDEKELDWALGLVRTGAPAYVGFAVAGTRYASEPRVDAVLVEKLKDDRALYEGIGDGGVAVGEATLDMFVVRLGADVVGVGRGGDYTPRTREERAVAHARLALWLAKRR